MRHNLCPNGGRITTCSIPAFRNCNLDKAAAEIESYDTSSSQQSLAPHVWVASHNLHRPSSSTHVRVHHMRRRDVDSLRAYLTRPLAPLGSHQLINECQAVVTPQPCRRDRCHYSQILPYVKVPCCTIQTMSMNPFCYVINDA